MAKKEKNKPGFIKDIQNDTSSPLRWVGHWGRDGKTGCAIVFKDIPRMELTVGKVYLIMFKHVSRHYPKVHEINGFFKLWGVDYIDYHGTNYTKPKAIVRLPKIRHNKYLIFESVNPLEACEMIHP